MPIQEAPPKHLEDPAPVKETEISSGISLSAAVEALARLWPRKKHGEDNHAAGVGS